MFTAWDLEEKQEHSESHIKVSFVAKGDSAMFAHMALVHFLRWGLKEGQQIHWRSFLAKENIIKNMENFTSAVEKALEQGVVYHVLHQQPHTVPDFVKIG